MRIYILWELSLVYYTNLPSKNKIIQIQGAELAGNLMLFIAYRMGLNFGWGAGRVMHVSWANPTKWLGMGGPLAPGHSYPMQHSSKEQSLFWSSLLGWLRLYWSASWSEVFSDLLFPTCLSKGSNQHLRLKVFSAQSFYFTFTHLPFTDVSFPFFPQTSCNPDYIRVGSLEDPNRYSL